VKNSTNLSPIFFAAALAATGTATIMQGAVQRWRTGECGKVIPPEQS